MKLKNLNFQNYGGKCVKYLELYTQLKNVISTKIRSFFNMLAFVSKKGSEISNEI